jgi:hypothetical protein
MVGERGDTLTQITVTIFVLQEAGSVEADSEVEREYVVRLS